MQKGEQTRQSIIEQSAQVFSKHGYAGTSIGDLMDVTGLSKGAIYNHFKNKDELAIEAFDYAIAQMEDMIAEAIRRVPRHAVHRLTAIVEAHRDYLAHPVSAGGCPLLNTSVEADDTHPALRGRAQQAMDTWRTFLIKEVERGIAEGQLRPGIEPDVPADVIIAALEGGIMISKLYGDSAHINRVVDHLVDYIHTTLAAP